MRRRLIILLALAFLLVSTGCANRRVAIDYADEQLHRAPTKDDRHVGLVHLPPVGQPKDAPPLILCHGFTSTSATFDLGNGFGLGPHLAAAGYDVWMVNLRGRWHSTRPYDGAGKNLYDWTFDDHMNFDVPAAIGYVKKQTDADKITWIGHSMGGLLIYAYIGSFGQNDVDKIVTIGAPVRFHPLDKMSEIYMAAGTRLIPQYQGVPAEPIFKVIAAPMSKMPAISAWVLNPYNFSQDTSYRYMANSIPNLSGGTMRQIGRWAKTDRFDSMDGSIDYRAGLSKITVPALVMGGKLDNLAPTWATYPGYESIASADKSYVLLGQANGCREDHAHGGIVLGNWAKAEVYQVIQDWLDTQNTNAKGE